MKRLPKQAIRIFSTAWPAIGESYLLNLLGMMDMFFVAKLGLTAVAAVGVTGIYGLTFLGMFTAASTALSVFLARAVGAKHPDEGRAVTWHGFLIAFSLGLVTGLISILFTRPLLHIMGAHGTLESMALPYFRVVLGSSPLIALFTAQSAAFRATGDTRTPLRIAFEMNILHVGLDYILIFGVGSFHGLGLTGAAMAMIIARLYALTRLWLRSRRATAIRLSRADLHLSANVFISMSRFAGKAALERLSMRLGQVLYFSLIVRMGVNVYATHNIAGTLTTFSSTIGSGFAIAATTTIGQAIGSGNSTEVQVYRRWSFILSALSMTVVTALLCLTSPWLGRLFTDNHQVIQLLFVILAIDTVSQPFLAAVLIDTSAIQAGGNSFFPMLTTFVGIWGVRTLGVYLFAWRLELGLPAVWASIAVDNALRAALFLWYRRTHTI